MPDGKIKSCGNAYESNVCYDYDPSSDSWSRSESMINDRNSAKGSFIGHDWLVSGNLILPESITTEYWTGSEFMAGPDIPVNMGVHCQLTLNSTHVFFVQFNRDPAYLLEWETLTWTELPSFTQDMTILSCGLIYNPENGLEAVVTHGDVSEIFNFGTLQWRPGPSGEHHSYAGHTQHGDTFLLQSQDEIYMFDNINYSWVNMGKLLQTPRSDFPGLITVPDEFVSCE